MPVGAALVRVFNGRPYVVVRCPDAWLYEGEYYPTLYAVMCVALGRTETTGPRGKVRRVPPWSAHRFFGLRTRADELRRRRDPQASSADLCTLFPAAEQAFQLHGLPFDAAAIHRVPWASPGEEPDHAAL